MKIVKRATPLALTGLFVSFCPRAHAEPAGLLKSLESSDLSSYIPLAIFFVSAIVVYLCNRPRMTLCPRARRRTESSHGEARG